MGLLSPEEKIFIVHGAEQNVRSDGRTRLQYRAIEVEVDLLPGSMGSSRVKIGETDVLACVKANPFTPPCDKPTEGKLELLVHFSCVSDPENEARTGEQLMNRYTDMLNKLYSSVRLKEWCIVPNVKCWKFYVDICVIALDGNLFDALGMAVKSALATSVVPIVRVSNEDKGETEISISDDPCDVWTPDVTNIPLFVTVSKIGDTVILDATAQEEQCSSFRFLVGCTDSGKKLFRVKTGAGSIHPMTLTTLLKTASAAGVQINKLLKNLISEKSKNSNEIFGYL